MGWCAGRHEGQVIVHGDRLRRMTSPRTRLRGCPGTLTPKVEGERAVPQLFLVIEWPSKEAADAFYETDEYRPYRERRRAGARNKLVLVAGEDAAATSRAPRA